MYILGISAYYHDSAACLLQDDCIIAACQEERFTRKKNDESFPSNAIRYCLEAGKINLGDLDHIVFYEKPFLKFERLLETYLAFAPLGFLSFLKAMPIWLKEKLFLKKNIVKSLVAIDDSCDVSKIKLSFTHHHLSHAASAFYPSPFTQAVILTADGVGEWTTTSIAVGELDQIHFKKEIHFPNSVGLLYSAFTYYLGFKVNVDEYKVMGLAPYGKPVYVDLIFDKVVNLKPDGSFRLNMHYFNYCAGLTMTSGAFNELFGKMPRKPNEELTQFYMDIASSIQAVTEKIMLAITTSLYLEYKVDNLCMAGGVALNCVANEKILKASGFKNIWIQPAAGDAGGALGAAFAIYHHYADNKRNNISDTDKMQNALLGPYYDNETIKACLLKQNVTFTELSDEEYYATIAGYLDKGKVVGWFSGRMEFGPRALGSRSILADPRVPQMQSILNQKIKFRESFRPFAPAILEEYAADYFDIEKPSPYMLFTSKVNSKQVHDPSFFAADNKPALKDIPTTIPAVTHVNLSARVQTVNEKNGDFYKLLTSFHERTGCPVLINTSFNVMDEPIVCTPYDALKCFRSSGIDVLAFPNIIITK